MRRVPMLCLMIGLAFVLAIPVAGMAEYCQGSLCAGVTTESDNAYVDWWDPSQGGGHIDFGQRAKKFWQGGVVVQTYTESWVGIGTPNYGCGGPVPAGSVTKNPDGSWTLSFTDLGGQLGCSASVTWRPKPGDEADQLYTNHWSRLDPNTGGFELSFGENQGQPATASGTVAMSSITTNTDQQWAEMQSGTSGCATNSNCGF